MNQTIERHESAVRGYWRSFPATIDTAGIDDQVLKFLAPLTTEESDLVWGLDVLARAASDVAHEQRVGQAAA